VFYLQAISCNLFQYWFHLFNHYHPTVSTPIPVSSAMSSACFILHSAGSLYASVEEVVVLEIGLNWYFDLEVVLDLEVDFEVDLDLDGTGFWALESAAATSADSRRVVSCEATVAARAVAQGR